MAKESKPSAILLDLMMPKMNGIEVLRRLKSDATTQNIPVIVFTALIQDLEKQESFAAGASEYVVKTEVTPKAILDKIHQFTAANQIPGSIAPAPTAENKPVTPQTISPEPPPSPQNAASSGQLPPPPVAL
jgi:DNA-binding response OmpR family regulator